mgnify:CR=1 FL=1
MTRHNQRAVLGYALKFIQFPLMTTEDFGICAKSGLLEKDKVISVFLKVQSSDFVSMLRDPHTCLIVHRFNAVGFHHWTYYRRDAFDKMK